MRMLSRAGRLEDAERLLEEMEAHFCVPNEVHYNILMDGWGRLGDIETMQQKFLDMRSAGCQPDVWAYNSLVRNFGRWDYEDAGLHTTADGNRSRHAIAQGSGFMV